VKSRRNTKSLIVRNEVKTELHKWKRDSFYKMELLTMHLETWYLPWTEEQKKERAKELQLLAEHYWGPQALVNLKEDGFVVTHPDGKNKVFKKEKYEAPNLPAGV
jgi:hypothetical protein